MVVDCRVDKLTVVKGVTTGLSVRYSDGTRSEIRCRHASCAAARSRRPALLQRSGVRGRIGRSLAGPSDGEAVRPRSPTR
jgi:hypothetical protein